MIARCVNYEIPAIKKQITKCQQLQKVRKCFYCLVCVCERETMCVYLCVCVCRSSECRTRLCTSSTWPWRDIWWLTNHAVKRKTSGMEPRKPTSTESFVSGLIGDIPSRPVRRRDRKVRVKIKSRQSCRRVTTKLWGLKSKPPVLS